MTNSLKIRRIQIRDFLGIRDLTIEPPESGAVIKGENGQGKTSVLRSIQACLTGQGADADAIRLGADRAEILIDLDNATVRRLIKPSGSTVSVTQDGATWQKPQTRLNELLGAKLDPLEFYLAKPPERRKLVLQAMPLRVTHEQVTRWCAGDPILTWFDKSRIESAHGLEVLAAIRDTYYRRRTEANAEAKAARQAADAHPFRDVPVDAPLLYDADVTLKAADRALEELQIKAARMEGARQANAKTMDEARAIRGRIDGLLASAPAAVPAQARAAQADKAEKATREVHRLEAELMAARLALTTANTTLKAMDAQDADAQRAVDEAERMQATAATLEIGCAKLADDPAEPLEAQIEAANQRMTYAKVQHARATERAEVETHNAGAGARREAAEKAEKFAAELDTIVKRLTDDAPAELARSPGVIPGLGFTEEGITMDGKAIDKLSGAEQLLFAVEVAKRFSARAKILVVDGLERLSDSNLRAFLEHATSGGWQVFCSRVADGDLVVEAIEAGEGRAGP